MGGPGQKYDFSGIGGASASVVLALLAANPATAWLTTTIVVAPIFKWMLTVAFSMAASVGLVILNVGAEAVEGMIDQHGFDGSWDTAEKIVDAARNAGQAITPAQAKAIDDPVIAAFRKFASFARQDQ